MYVLQMRSKKKSKMHMKISMDLPKSIIYYKRLKFYEKIAKWALLKRFRIF